VAETVIVIVPTATPHLTSPITKPVRAIVAVGAVAAVAGRVRLVLEDIGGALGGGQEDDRIWATNEVV
jgi:hypothetical protein